MGDATELLNSEMDKKQSLEQAVWCWNLVGVALTNAPTITFGSCQEHSDCGASEKCKKDEKMDNIARKGTWTVKSEGRRRRKGGVVRMVKSVSLWEIINGQN